MRRRSVATIASMSGRSTFTATVCPSRSRARWTTAIDARPIGVSSKDANASYDRTFHWSIQKQVDKTLVKQVGGSTTFNYSVSVTHDSGTDSNWQVGGTITVTNPNPAGNGSNNAAGVDVVDNILSSFNSTTNTKIQDPNASCVVNNGSATGLTVAENAFISLPYFCTYSQAPAAS